MRVRLFSKPGCHLCEDAEREVRRFAHATIEIIDISRDDEISARYGLRIPVLQVDDTEFDAPLEREVIRRALGG